MRGLHRSAGSDFAATEQGVDRSFDLRSYAMPRSPLQRLGDARQQRHDLGMLLWRHPGGIVVGIAGRALVSVRGTMFHHGTAAKPWVAPALAVGV